MHLSSSTNKEPIKRDYLNYAMTIVAAYPELKGGKADCGILKTQLSTCIRNYKHKANLRKKKISKGTSSTAAMASVEPMKETMQKTLTVRRTWVQKEAKGISDVVEKYPHFKKDSVVLFELSIMKNWLKGGTDSFIARCATMTAELGKYFSIDQSDEFQKAQTLVKFCAEFHNKKFQNFTPLVIVKEVMSSTEDLIAGKGSSPRLVMYTSEGGLAAAYVVADSHKIKILHPSVAKSVACLLASYYVMDTSYPSAYKNVMDYIDRETLGTVTKDNVPVDKFVRERNRRLSTLK